MTNFNPERDTVSHGGRRWRIIKQTYPAGGRTAVVLYRDPEDFFAATINLPDEPLAENEVLIRNTEENEGVLPVLVEAGIVEDTGRTVRSGYINVHVCKLLI